MAHTLQLRGHKSKRKRPNKNCHDDIYNLAGISMTLIDEGGAKAER